MFFLSVCVTCFTRSQGFRYERLYYHHVHDIQPNNPVFVDGTFGIWAIELEIIAAEACISAEHNCLYRPLDASFQEGSKH